MKFIKFLVLGIVFGIVMAKSEAISWFRIQEMFRFQAFHMYGIIGTAVILGVTGVALIKKFKIRDFHGACPGPMVVNIGCGFLSMSIVFFFAIAGTYLYGRFRDKIPH